MIKADNENKTSEQNIPITCHEVRGYFKSYFDMKHAVDEVYYAILLAHLKTCPTCAVTIGKSMKESGFIIKLQQMYGIKSSNENEQ